MSLLIIQFISYHVVHTLNIFRGLSYFPSMMSFSLKKVTMELIFIDFYLPGFESSYQKAVLYLM